MAKGTWHVVGPGDDLMHLAAWYYGDAAAWGHIFWLNYDVYGDDFEAVPCGTKVFIPDLETAAGRGILKMDVLPHTVTKRVPGPGVADFVLRQGEKKTAFEIMVTPEGGKEILYHFPDNSEVLTGPRGVTYAAEVLEVQPEQLSNAQGSVGGGPAEEPFKDGAAKGVPDRRRARPRHPVAQNVLRTAVAAFYGHSYMLFEVLKANDLDECDVFSPGLPVKLPPRAKLHRCEDAAKWRERLGRR
jgi:hypothetical protein